MDQEYNHLIDGIKLIKEANDNLNRIRNEYKDDPELLSIYEHSSLKLLEDLKQSLNEYLFKNDLLNTPIKPDFWIRLKGKSFENGRAPLSAVGAFLQKLVIANQHAVSIIDNIKYDGGRFSRRIKELAEFDIVATSPGSLQIGLKKPLPSKFFCSEDDNNLMIDEIYASYLNKAYEDSNKSMEGISLLVKAIEASEDVNKLDELKKEVANTKDILRLLYYATEITPSSTSEIEEIVIVNNEYLNNREIRYDNKTRYKLRKISDDIVKDEKYVEGVGIVREVDLDKLTFRVNNFKTYKITVENLSCKINEENEDKNKLNSLLNVVAKFSGFLTYSQKGEIKFLEVNQITFVNEEDQD